MDAAVFRAFVKEAISKTAFDWQGFREGVWDEGIPLGGATIGAALGARRGNVLRGAALGYAAGGGASLGRSFIRGEKPSTERMMLAGGALGYGAGGLAHGALEGLASKRPGTLGQKLFHPVGGKPTWQSALVEEGLPALGATLGTGTAMGMAKKKKNENL